MIQNAKAPDEGLVWIELHVEMGRTDADDYVSIPRAEWDAMTEDEREKWCDEALEDHISNHVSAGHRVADADDVPDGYR